MRDGHVSSVYGVQTINSESSFLLCQNLPCAQVKNELTVEVDAVDELRDQNFEGLKLITLAEPVEVKVAELQFLLFFEV